jgi:outer membrane protein TolC
MTITLDTVLHLAEEKNLQVNQARARVDEAEARCALADCWLHPYQKVNAERKLWQQRAELSKLTAETMLEAAGTYVDLVAAQAGRAIVLQTGKDLNPLLERAQKLAAAEPGAQTEVVRIRAELEGSQQEAESFAVQASAAAAKLVYLLALEPCTELVPADCALAPYHLADVRMTCCELVHIALSQGPAVQEISRMVAVIDEAATKAHGGTRPAPAGKAEASSSLAGMFHRADRKKITLAEQDQAHLALEDVRAKLAAGVQEAYETILGVSEQLQHGSERVKYAQESRKRSQDRLNDNVPGSSSAEVLISLQSLALAQLKYLSAIRDYDKAQLRLMIFTGGSHGSELCPPAHALEEIK